MNPHAGKLVLNGAPSQLSRLLPSPDAARARVDGRTLDELRAFGWRLAGLLVFYGLDDRPDGDWSAFFGAHPAMVEAALRSAAAPAAEEAYAQLALGMGEEADAGARQALLATLFALPRALARQVDAWLLALRALPSPAARRAERRLAAAVTEELAPALRRLRAWEAGAVAAGALPAGAAPDPALSAAWEADAVRADPSIFRGATPADRMDAAVPHLVAAFGALADGLAGVRSAAEGLGMDAADGAQRPQLALFDAFARLFGFAQAALDGVAPRLADFYYREVLRERERGPEPDAVYLAFALEPDRALPSGVPRGTLFSAGTDADGRALLYAADRGLAVTRAALARVRMLRAVRGPLLPPALPAPGDPVVGVLASRLVDAGGAELGGEALAAGEGWPTFGAAEAGTVGALETAPGALGFAVASRELLLAGGRRSVAVTVRFAPDETLASRLEAVAAAAGLVWWEALAAVLEAALDFSLSTADGWLAVKGFQAAVRPVAEGGGGRLSLQLELPPAAPAVVPLFGGGPPPDGADPGVNPAPGLPTLRAFVRPGPVAVTGRAGTALVEPLPLVDALRVRALEVHTRVHGLADLAVANGEGPVDASAPFPVFGGAPAVGSFLELRSPELFAKLPGRVRVTLAWAGLPPNADGFRGWYRDYVIGLDGTREEGLFDNATFTGRWSVVNPGRWRLPPDPVALFRSQPGGSPPPPCVAPAWLPDGALCPRTRFAAVPEPTGGLPPYYDPAGSALRLELAGPPYAFGNDLYAVNVLNAVLQDLPDAGGCQAGCEAACGPLLDAALALDLCAGGSPPALDTCLADARDALLAAATGCVGPACLAMQEGAAAIQGCLDAPGGPTPACASACAAALRAAYAQTLQRCIEACMGARPELRYPNLPYLPQATVAVDYSSACRVTPAAGDGCGALYHLLPFGGWTAAGGEGGDEPRLVPVPAGGASLLLGFGGMEEAQTLTLLFQLAVRAGSAGAAEPPPVAWGWLDGDRWRVLAPGAVPADGTQGLRNSGIVALELPRGGAGGNRLPGPERWVCAAVASGADAFPWTVSLSPHALTASWHDTGDGAGAHLATPLPAGTISTPVQALPGIGAIVQPMPSFGGRPPETGRTFQARLGERLRHKERAVQPWDYERLVLERFPQLWKAQALPARGAGGPAPGAVLVVVVAGAEGNESADLTVPRAPGALLGRVRDFLAGRASPFAAVEVVNPAYVRVQVHAEVSFRTGEAGGDADRLDRDLVAWLSPWHYGAERAASEGRYAFEPDVGEFIQTRPYVAALYAFELTHDPPVEGLEWYFLTSAARHAILDHDLTGDDR